MFFGGKPGNKTGEGIKAGTERNRNGMSPLT